MYNISFARQKNYVFSGHRSLRPLVNRLNDTLKEFTALTNEYVFDDLHWDFYAERVTSNMILMLMKAKCFKKDYDTLLLRLTSYGMNSFADVISDDMLAIEIADTTNCVVESALDYCDNMAEKTYPEYENVLKDSEDQTVKIGKNRYGRYFTLASSIKYDLIFKILLLALEEEEKNLDTPLKEKQYNAVVNFFKACITKNEEKANEAMSDIEEILQEWDLENCKELFKYDEDLIKRQYREEKRNLESAVNRCRNDLCVYYKQLEDLSVKYATVKGISDENLNDTLEYIKNNKYLTILNNYTPDDQGNIYLKIEAPLVYYDEDFLETMIEHQDYTPEWDFKGYVLFDRIFLQREYKLWTYSIIRLNLSNFSTMPVPEYRNENTKGYFEHPHLMEWRCQGNHEPEIQKWIHNRDYIGCFEQIIAMAMNLNFSDSTVVERMFERLQQRSIENVVCFENTETGTFYSFQEIVDMIREE